MIWFASTMFSFLQRPRMYMWRHIYYLSAACLTQKWKDGDTKCRWTSQVFFWTTFPQHLLHLQRSKPGLSQGNGWWPPTPWSTERPFCKRLTNVNVKDQTWMSMSMIKHNWEISNYCCRSPVRKMIFTGKNWCKSWFLWWSFVFTSDLFWYLFLFLNLIFLW